MPDSVAEIEIQKQNLRPPVLPQFELFPQVNTKLGEVIVKRLGPETRARYKKYADVTRLGVFAITGFGGSGKTEILALTALLFLGHSGIDTVYCCALTDSATTVFAERLHRLADEVGAQAGELHLLVVRGYNLDIEASAFVEMASAGGPARG